MSRKTVEKWHEKTAFLSADTLVDTWVIFIIILVMNEEVRFHMKKATSQDVAALAGVSQATVSLILNNSSKITFSSETRERVLAAAQQLNYHLPARKKASAQAGSRMLLVLTPTLTNQYYSEIIQTIEQYADSLDYRVIVCNTFRKPELEKFYLNTFVDAHVDGIIYTFLPSFPRLVEKIAELCHQKQLEGISDIRDESDRTGMRAVIELKKDADPQRVLAYLYKYSDLQITFGVNMVAIAEGKPLLMGVKSILHYFIEHQKNVVTRRTRYELAQAQARAHILQGLMIAVDNLDEVIALIRASKNPKEAKQGLMARFELDDVQAQAILDMRLQRLTNLELLALKKEYEDLLKLISRLEAILKSEKKLLGVIRTELQEIADEFAAAEARAADYCATHARGGRGYPHRRGGCGGLYPRRSAQAYGSGAVSQGALGAVRGQERSAPLPVHDGHGRDAAVLYQSGQLLSPAGGRAGGDQAP